MLGVKKMKRRNMRKVNQSVDMKTMQGPDPFRSNAINWSKGDEANFETVDISPKGSPMGNRSKLAKIHEKTLMTDKKVRQSLNLKIQKSDQEDGMKPLKYKGGKVMYRSIEKPLKLYCHGMRIVDITNPNNQKEIRNSYVQNYNKEMAIQYQSLLG